MIISLLLVYCMHFSEKLLLKETIKQLHKNKNSDQKKYLLCIFAYGEISDIIAKNKMRNYRSFESIFIEKPGHLSFLDEVSHW